VAAECSGTCSGKCLVDQGAAECTGGVSCRGSCDAQCEGSCEGSFTPPKVSASCEAEADCQASASAEANASLDCTPPQLKIDYTLNGTVNGNLEAKAAFTAKLNELKVRGIAILQGSAKYEALLTGRVEGRVVFETSPLAQLQASMTGVVSGGFDKFEVPAGKVLCLAPAFAEAGQIASRLVTGTAGKLQAQAKFVADFKGLSS
jgi:hypothetical protein